MPISSEVRSVRGERTGVEALNADAGFHGGDGIALAPIADRHERIEEILQNTLAGGAFAGAQSSIELIRKAGDEVEDGGGIGGEARTEIRDPASFSPSSSVTPGSHLRIATHFRLPRRTGSPFQRRRTITTARADQPYVFESRIFPASGTRTP